MEFDVDFKTKKVFLCLYVGYQSESEDFRFDQDHGWNNPGSQIPQRGQQDNVTNLSTIL